MKLRSRAFVFGLFAVASMTSGCAHRRTTCWGWRFHPRASCSVPISAPVVYHPVAIVEGGSGCPSCGGGPSPVIHPPGGYPAVGYPPTIANPMPPVTGK
jgi:hypothetical protein